MLIAGLFAACSAGETEPRAAEPSPVEVAPATPRRSPEREPKGWRRTRYIPVREAVQRLRRHVDVPVVLPRDRIAGLPSYRGWSADPKYLEWTRRGRVTVGTLKLVSRRDYLWIEYGFAIPDGCGGRDTAIPTDVRGEPALLWPGDGHSAVIWPVRPHGRSGRFGLVGSFAGYGILRLAESMEARLREAPAARATDPGC
jgi:hypothetical protein